MRRTSIILGMVVGVMLLLSCGTKQVDDPLSAEAFTISEMSALHGTTGEERDTFYRYETLYLTIEDLFPRWQTSVEIVQGDDCYAVHDHMLVITDEEGRITDLPVWINIGVDENGNPVDESGSYAIRIVQASSKGTWNKFRIEFTVVNGLAPFAMVQPTNAAGVFNNGAALEGEDIYAGGNNLGAGAEVRLYVVDSGTMVQTGMLYSDVTGGFETVNADANGSLPNTLVWTGATAGAYDVVADVAPFGEYNAGDAVTSIKSTGLTVQAPAGVADIVQDVACDITGSYLNQFDESDPVFAMVNPLIRPTEILSPVAIYVTDHRDVWAEGDELTTVETVGSHTSPTICVTNPVSGSLALVQLRGEPKPQNRQPLNLWPGDYDVVIDMNMNGVYDPGIDVLDGGSQVGFTVTGDGVPGETPKVKFFFGSALDYDQAETGERRVFLLVTDGDGNPVVDAPVYFNVGRGPGSVDPTETMTDANGYAETFYSGSEYGQYSIIRTRVRVDNAWRQAWISVWGEIPCTHDQGILIGG